MRPSSLDRQVEQPNTNPARLAEVDRGASFESAPTLALIAARAQIANLEGQLAAAEDRDAVLARANSLQKRLDDLAGDQATLIMARARLETDLKKKTDALGNAEARAEQASEARAKAEEIAAGAQAELERKTLALAEAEKRAKDATDAWAYAEQAGAKATAELKRKLDALDRTEIEIAQMSGVIATLRWAAAHPEDAAPAPDEPKEPADDPPAKRKKGK